MSNSNSYKVFSKNNFTKLIDMKEIYGIEKNNIDINNKYVLENIIIKPNQITGNFLKHKFLNRNFKIFKEIDKNKGYNYKFIFDGYYYDKEIEIMNPNIIFKYKDKIYIDKLIISEYIDYYFILNLKDDIKLLSINDLTESEKIEDFNIITELYYTLLKRNDIIFNSQKYILNLLNMYEIVNLKREKYKIIGKIYVIGHEFEIILKEDNNLYYTMNLKSTSNLYNGYKFFYNKISNFSIIEYNNKLYISKTYIINYQNDLNHDIEQNKQKYSNHNIEYKKSLPPKTETKLIRNTPSKIEEYTESFSSRPSNMGRVHPYNRYLFPETINSNNRIY